MSDPSHFERMSPLETAGNQPAGIDQSGIEQAAVAAIDETWMLELLTDLVAFRSDGGDESPAQRHMASVLAEIGMDVDLWEIDLDHLATDPDFSAEVTRDEALGVVGHIGGPGPALMFNGHIDVVPVGDLSQWATPPWEATQVDGNVAGRGTVDMKAGLVCAAAAVRAVTVALRDAGRELTGSVSIASVVGEEDGGLGTLATLARGHTADAAVVVEPTAGEIATSQAGALGFRITVPGRPAHGALRNEGVSAVEKFRIVHDALMALEHRRNGRLTDPMFAHLELPLALSIGTVHAGEWASTVPDRLVAEGRYGVAPGEDIAAARRELEVAVADAAATDPWLSIRPPRVEWWGGQFHPTATAPDAGIVTVLGECHRLIASSDAPVRGVPYGSDLRHLVNRGGIASVLYGPGDVRLAHGPNEQVPVAELIRVAHTLAILIVRFCGTGPVT